MMLRINDLSDLYGGGSNYWFDLVARESLGHEWHLVTFNNGRSGFGCDDSVPSPFRVCYKCKYIQSVPYWGWDVLENPPHVIEPPKCGEEHKKPEWVDGKQWETIG